MKAQTKTVFVGLSGGVDSSVSALRLIRQGYNVVGVFIKTWQPDFIHCDWEKERLDAMRVAAKLNIPFLTCDAEESYKTGVADYMINEYKNGRTPNPDVMCNKYVKFDTFLKFALERGADSIATGHYAQVYNQNDRYVLKRGTDTNKDQSYFLWTLTQDQLKHTLFPIGDTNKDVVRKEAQKAGLLTYAKSDSQGICFLGEIDVQNFLSHYIKTEKGNVIDVEGNIIGIHEGALFYTLGQRHGFSVTITKTKSSPLFVVAKDVTNNTITVSDTFEVVNGQRFALAEVNIIAESVPKTCTAQFRYRQKPFAVTLEEGEDEHVILTVLDTKIELPSLGQSCVLYLDDECVGGGIIQKYI